MSRSPIRIALSGPKGSGKTVAAATLVANYDTKLRSFAGPLKQLVGNLFNIEDMYLYKDKEEIIPGLNCSARKLLQVVGTELFRDALIKHIPEIKLFGGSIWIHKLISDLPDNVVVDDCRFEDEYKALKKAGFVVVRLKRGVQSTDSHASEQGCPADVEIDNNGSMQELWSKLDTVVKERDYILYGEK